MKTIFFLVTFFYCITNLDAQKKPLEMLSAKRIEKVINSNWTFNYFPKESADKGYESPGYDDSQWPAISLPHTWNTYETTGDRHPFVLNPDEEDNMYWWIGWGWYRKHFAINCDLTGKKVFVEFKGAQDYCKVWINGKYLGDHRGRNGSFDFDITGYLKKGQDNLLAVAVNNFQEDKLKIPSLTADNSNDYGGLSRDVTLVLRSNIYIPMQGSAVHEGGTYVSVPVVSDNEGIVRVQTWVKNDSPQNSNCTLHTSVIDANGKIVIDISSAADIKSGQLYKFDQITKPVRKPHLWTPSDPYLYSVLSEVIVGKEIVDTYNSPLGFRWFSWDNKSEGLILNGKKMMIQGGNFLNDYPWLGDVLPGWITEMDYRNYSKMLKFNFMPVGESPGDELVYKLADKYGIIVKKEFSSLKKDNIAIEIKEQQIKEIIRRDRNHPSIFFWSVGYDTNNAISSKIVLEEDTTRIIITSLSTFNSLFADEAKNYTITSDKPLTSSSDPAKIILSCSHQKLLADRGSLAIITADIADSKGRHIDGTANTISWSISGPATLVGPAYSEDDKKDQHKLQNSGLMQMPYSNIIRSTGTPGNIRIRVSSAGLASGTLDLVVEEENENNTYITEPVLDNEGRKPVARVRLYARRLDEVPYEIKLTESDINMGSALRHEHEKNIRDYLIKNNPLLDSATTEFRALVNLFSYQLFNNNGHMCAEDYNFNAGHYNTCRLIYTYIEATKLPQLFKSGLRKYYADAIIKLGNEKNAGEEMNWLNWIPSGGMVVISLPEGKISGLKGVKVTEKSDLSDIITLVYPSFINFSEEARERALLFISKMNPYVRTHIITGQAGTEKNEMKTTISYSAEKGKPILIPDFKFISE